MASDTLGRYYTDSSISRLLVESLQAPIAKTILEIGVGGGALAKAALFRYQNARLVSADIEGCNKSIVDFKPDRVVFHTVNGLSQNFGKKIKVKVGQIDVAICNPPYMKLSMKKHFRKLLSDVGFHEQASKGQLTSDILFLAQNLRLLKNGGEVGIILPDTLLSGIRFEAFRTDILNTLTITGVIKLPEKVFSKTTEAATHILLLKKVKPKVPYQVSIKVADSNGNIVNNILVSSCNLADRMDYNFHFYQSGRLPASSCLSIIRPIIFRGHHSKKDLVESIGQGRFFHLNNYKPIEGSRGHLRFRKMPLLSNFAQAGDVLLARVGKRSLGAVAYVVSGKVTISDCIFVIRVPTKYQQRLFKCLKSAVTQDFIQAHSSGVCSRFISIKAILSIPFSIKGK